MEYKYFCIGFNKTGTTSIGRTLELLLNTKKSSQLLFEKNINYYYKNDFNNIIKLCENETIFQDIPFSLPETYKYLDKYFNNAKFILTIRNNSEEWYNSLLNFHKKIFYKKKKITKSLVKSIKKYDIYKFIKYIYKTDDDDLYNKEKIKKIYENYNNDIIEYFKNTDKLIVINLSIDNDFNRLLNFLNIDKNKININKFLHLNKCKYN